MYDWAIGLLNREFTNGLGVQGSIAGWVIPKTQKMVLDAAFLNTQHYKVRIKSKVEQTREWSSTLPQHLGVVAIEKRAFGLPSTMVANFTYIVYKYYFLKKLRKLSYTLYYSILLIILKVKIKIIPVTVKTII